MTFRMTAMSRFFALFTVLWCLTLFATACTTTWASEATNIIQLLVPAISSILSILTAFGAGISPAALTAVQSWAGQATTGLQTVAGLIDQYNAADAGAQPGILSEIQAALQVIINNLNTILPEIHVDDPGTQAKITAIIGLVADEMTALINLVPALKGQVTGHDEFKALVAKVKSPKEFRSEFNAAVEPFGKQYEIGQ